VTIETEIELEKEPFAYAEVKKTDGTIWSLFPRDTTSDVELWFKASNNMLDLDKHPYEIVPLYRKIK
jgi:hypothetical protein